MGLPSPFPTFPYPPFLERLRTSRPTLTSAALSMALRMSNAVMKAYAHARLCILPLPPLPLPLLSPSVRELKG